MATLLIGFAPRLDTWGSIAIGIRNRPLAALHSWTVDLLPGWSVGPFAADQNRVIRPPARDERRPSMSTLKTDAPTASAQLAVSEPNLPAPRASILLVDDQPARLLSYEAILLGLGVQCVRALSGAQALERLLEQEFAAILLDVNMPEMDGFEVARLVREHPRMER